MSSPSRALSLASTVLNFSLSTGERALKALESWLDARLNRSLISGLYAQDDRMLRDIGVTRADVVAALLVPVSQDPSRVLADRCKSAKLAKTELAREVLNEASFIEVRAPNLVDINAGAAPPRASLNRPSLAA